MSFWGIVAATVISGTLGGLTDWLFMGVLFHENYNTHPEIWREGVRDGKEQGAIIWSSALGYLMSLCIILLCALTGERGIGPCLAIAVLAYLAGPLPMQLINAMFIKFDPKITASHSLGYFARFFLAGLTAGFFLR